MLWILLSDSVIPYNSGSHRLADTLAIIFWLSFWRQHVRDGAQMILIFVPAQGWQGVLASLANPSPPKWPCQRTRGSIVGDVPGRSDNLVAASHSKLSPAQTTSKRLPRVDRWSNVIRWIWLVRRQIDICDICSGYSLYSIHKYANSGPPSLTTMCCTRYSAFTNVEPWPYFHARLKSSAV